MMRTSMLIAMASLAGCGSALETEADRYKFLAETNAPREELCAQAERALTAAIDARDTAWTNQWRFTRDNDCETPATPI